MKPTRRIVCLLEVNPAELAAAAERFPQFEWVQSSRAHAARDLPGAEIVFGPPREAEIRHAAGMKWVQSSSAGVEKLARTPFFMESDFVLTTCAGMHDSCAEHAIALLLGLTRFVGLYARWRPDAASGAGGTPCSYDAAMWEGRKTNPSPRVLRGSTLGVLGLGAIGRAVGRIAQAMGMHVVGVNFSGTPVAPHEAAETHPVARLDELLPRFDALVLVLPATPETDGLLSRARLAKLPAHALVVNVGRGNALDEAALIEALQAGRLAGAGLDVYAAEPLPPESPLYTLPNVVLTPHIGGNRPDYEARAFEIFLANLERYLSGKPLMNLVDRKRGY